MLVGSVIGWAVKSWHASIPYFYRAKRPAQNRIESNVAADVRRLFISADSERMSLAMSAAPISIRVHSRLPSPLSILFVLRSLRCTPFCDVKNQIITWRRRLNWLFQMLAQGNFRLLAIDFSLRVYRAAFYLPFWMRVLRRRSGTPHPSPLPGAEREKIGGEEMTIELKTKFPVAYESPDHLLPWGTMNDNSTNRKFVLFMDDLVRCAQTRSSSPSAHGGEGRVEVSEEFLGEGKGEGKQRVQTRQRRPVGYYAFMDLGCSGGQLVKDFKDLGWIAVGLEGSDYSLKHGRANWPKMAGKNLFTCDITKPFEVLSNQQPVQFDLITAWEVLEHIPPTSLDQLFRNIAGHLRSGGYFIASTTSAPDFHDGVDLHQSKFSNKQWRELMAAKVPELEQVDLGLKFYQFVRYNFEERSFLTCRRRG